MISLQLTGVNEGDSSAVNGSDLADADWADDFYTVNGGLHTDNEEDSSVVDREVILGRS